jgi:pimeloyl-ACP methyl ester carboxylesterase
MRSLILSAATVVALGAGLAAVPAAATTAVAWGACPSGAPAPQECTTLQVSLDYGKPGGRTIAVEVSRIPAADPARRKGVLLTNGGGPGPSLDVPTALGGLLPPSVRDSYDIVAFDPRGIGYSTPISCGRGADELVRDLQFSVLSFPAGNGSIGANVAYGKRMAQQCAAHSGGLLQHITTANVARDMDQIRRALGERTVSYYGISWGTYVGSLYRSLFPATVDRMVIDSSVDPALRGYQDFRTFGGALEDRWPDLAAFAVAHQDTVRLGATERQVRRNHLALAAKLDRRPVTLAGTKAPINGNFVRLVTWQLSYSDAALIGTPDAPVPLMAQFWRAAGNAAAGRLTAADRAVLAGLANDLVAKGTLPNVPQDNLFSAGWAYSCGDVAWPRDVRSYARNTAADRREFPLTAGAPANYAPCSAWTTRPAETEPAITPTGKRNVLILQNERDPATPLRTAQGMHRAMGRDSVLVTVDAGGHGVLVHPKPSACAVGALESYLAGGELPAKDRTCD